MTSADRILNAVEALAASADPIHRRLEAATYSLLPLQAGDFEDPADGELLERILRGVTGVSDPSGEHGDLAMSTLAMGDEEAVRIARLILELHRRVHAG